MLYAPEGIRLWPGGSLVSGNLADNGGGDAGTDATGVVSEWAPALPFPESSVADETTWIECGGCDAVRIYPILTGTAITGFDVLAMVLLVAFFDRIGGDQPAYLPRITQPRWESTALATLGACGAGTELPAGKWINGVESISSYYQPLVFPSDGIGQSNTLGTLGYGRDIAVTGASSALQSSVYTIPTGGAAAMAYRVNVCNIAGASAAITGVGIRLAYQKLQVVHSSRGEVNSAN